MSNNFNDQWMNFARSSFEPVMKANGITTRFFQELGQQNAQLCNEFFKSYTEQFGKAQKFEDFVAANSKLALDITPKTIEHTQSVFGSMLKCANEVRGLYEDGLKPKSPTK